MKDLEETVNETDLVETAEQTVGGDEVHASEQDSTAIQAAGEQDCDGVSALEATSDGGDADDGEALADEEAADTDDSEAGDGDETPEEFVRDNALPDMEIDLQAQVEAIVFASPKPVRAGDIVEILGYDDLDESKVEEVFAQIAESHEERQGGFRLVLLKGMGYQFQTVGEAAPIMERLFASRPRPISRAALETLSIIAYRQPVTRATIEFIRGVDSGSIVKNLLDRALIRCTGRKEDSPGRPMVFGTTDEFLRVFGIASLKDLPPLQSFQPDSEIMKEAMAELEKVESGEEFGVDVESFVGDEGHEPQVGEGLLQETAPVDGAAAEPAGDQLDEPVQQSADEAPNPNPSASVEEGDIDVDIASVSVPPTAEELN